MKWPPWKKQESPPDDDRPAPEAARRDLERLREQREKVNHLRRGYRQEYLRNHFGENIETIFRGQP